jgi:hypothetical protein
VREWAKRHEAWHGTDKSGRRCPCSSCLAGSAGSMAIGYELGFVCCRIPQERAGILSGASAVAGSLYRLPEPEPPGWGLARVEAASRRFLPAPKR